MVFSFFCDPGMLSRYINAIGLSATQRSCPTPLNWLFLFFSNIAAEGELCTVFLANDNGDGAVVYTPGQDQAILKSELRKMIQLTVKKALCNIFDYATNDYGSWSKFFMHCSGSHYQWSEERCQQFCRDNGLSYFPCPEAA